MRIAVMKQILSVLENVPHTDNCHECNEGIGVCGFCGMIEYKGHANDCRLTAAINALKSEIKSRGTQNPDQSG